MLGCKKELQTHSVVPSRLVFVLLWLLRRRNRNLRPPSYLQHTAHKIKLRQRACILSDYTVSGKKTDPLDMVPEHCRVTTLGKLFTHMCLCHQAV